MPSHISPNFAFLPPYAILCRMQWHPTPVLLPGKCYGWRSLVGCSPWGSEELDMNEWLHFHFSLSCIGEGNGNPLQCSCLENPRDGVAQSQTRLSGSMQYSEIFIIFSFYNVYLRIVLWYLRLSISSTSSYIFFFLIYLDFKSFYCLLHI